MTPTPSPSSAHPRRKDDQPRQARAVLTIVCGLVGLLIVAAAGGGVAAVSSRNDAKRAGDDERIRNTPAQIVVPRKGTRLCDRFNFNNVTGETLLDGSAPCPGQDAQPEVGNPDRFEAIGRGFNKTR